MAVVAENRGSRIAALAAVLGSPGLALCGTHFCRGGYMQHPPYAWWHHVSDVAWPILFAVGIAAAISSRKRRDQILCALLLGAVICRFAGPLEYMGFLLSVPLAIVVVAVAAPGLLAQLRRSRGGTSPNSVLQPAAPHVVRR
jgi:hypothetical protein